MKPLCLLQQPQQPQQLQQLQQFLQIDCVAMTLPKHSSLVAKCLGLKVTVTISFEHETKIIHHYFYIIAVIACPAKDTNCIAPDSFSNVINTTTDAENTQECGGKTITLASKC